MGEDDFGSATTFVDQMGVTFPVLWDDGGAVLAQYAQYGVDTNSAYPQDWIIGADGTVAYHNDHYEPDEMLAIIEAELAAAAE